MAVRHAFRACLAVRAVRCHVAAQPTDGLVVLGGKSHPADSVVGAKAQHLRPKTQHHAFEREADNEGKSFEGRNRGGEKKREKIRVPRWCQVRSSRPVARFLTLARPALGVSLAGLLRAISAWAPGSPPTGETYPTPRNSILPSTRLPCSPRPALCYRPSLALLTNLAVRKVTRLEPRTPHQPEKLKKRSKNDCLFTPSNLVVNRKSHCVTARVFTEVHAVHRPLTGFGAAHRHSCPPTPLGTRLLARSIDRTDVCCGTNNLFRVCEYR